ncbi:MAG: hypothetical protein CMO81_08060 [Waddliaceae bacterium]|nr:hypothetical protein [Waddliaceae bacterium]
MALTQVPKYGFTTVEDEDLIKGERDRTWGTSSIEWIDQVAEHSVNRLKVARIAKIILTASANVSAVLTAACATILPDSSRFLTAIPLLAITLIFGTVAQSLDNYLFKEKRRSIRRDLFEKQVPLKTLFTQHKVSNLIQERILSPEEIKFAFEREQNNSAFLISDILKKYSWDLFTSGVLNSDTYREQFENELDKSPQTLKELIEEYGTELLHENLCSFTFLQNRLYKEMEAMNFVAIVEKYRDFLYKNPLLIDAKNRQDLRPLLARYEAAIENRHLRLNKAEEQHASLQEYTKKTRDESLKRSDLKFKDLLTQTEDEFNRIECYLTQNGQIQEEELSVYERASLVHAQERREITLAQLKTQHSLEICNTKQDYMTENAALERVFVEKQAAAHLDFQKTCKEINSTFEQYRYGP